MRLPRTWLPRDFWQALSFGSIVAVVLGIATLVYAFVSLISLNEERVELNERYARSVTLVNGLRYRSSAEESYALRFALTRDLSFHRLLLEERKRGFEEIAKLRDLETSDQGIRYLNTITRLRMALGEATQPAFTAAHASDDAAAVHRFLDVHGRELHQKLTRVQDEFFQYELTQFGNARLRTDRYTRQLMLSFFAIAAVVAAASLYAVRMLQRVARLKQNQEGLRERLFHEIENTARIRKQTLQEVSHDLKSPLSSMKISLDLISREANEATLDPKSFAKLLKIPVRACEQMEDLIMSLLDQAQIEAGVFDLCMSEQNPYETISETVDLMRPLATQKSVQIRMDGGTVDSTLSFDRRRIRRVIGNLLGNAIKFSPQNEVIDITLSRRDQGVVISIRDRGPGLSEELRRRLFVPFSQAEATKHEGTGLGLSICKKIIEAHGESIWAESPDQGSLFAFSLGTRTKKIQPITNRESQPSV